MSIRMPLTGLLALVVATGAVAADPLATWHWAPSPAVDEQGRPLTTAVVYEVFLSRDGGAESLVATVMDTVWVQTDAAPGATYRVRVRAADALGIRSAPSDQSNPWTAPTPTIVPGAAGLSAGPAWPNPFNPATTIAYTVPENPAGPVTVRVLDLRGALVRTLDAENSPGDHTVRWDGTDDRGRAAGAGLYLVHVRCGADQAVTKVTMVK